MIKTNITKIGDPQIVVFENKYYCYCTSSDVGFKVWVSDDLENWSEPILCFRAIDYWGKSHFWAPEVVYHNGKFIMHYTAKDRESDSLRIGVAISSSPTGPFVDVHNKPLFDFGYAAIDATVLVTENGNYMYFSKDCSENIIDGFHTSQIYCIRLDETLTKTIGEPILMTTPTYDFELKSGDWLWNEGPNVIKYHDKYIMNYSANCYASNDYAICIAVASSPLGPWMKQSSNPVLTRNEDLFGAGHNAFFYSNNGKLMTAFAIQTDPKHPSGNRRVCIGKVDFEISDTVIKQKIY